LKRSSLRLPDLVAGEEEYEIDAIKNHRKKRGKTEYLVSWKGYSTAEDSWLVEAAFKHAKTILETYKKRLRIARILHSDTI
jgi:hypothetical protein